jgi:hypothetical protein
MGGIGRGRGTQDVQMEVGYPDVNQYNEMFVSM